MFLFFSFRLVCINDKFSANFISFWIINWLKWNFFSTRKNGEEMNKQKTNYTNYRKKELKQRCVNLQSNEIFIFRFYYVRNDRPLCVHLWKWCVRITFQLIDFQLENLDPKTSRIDIEEQSGTKTITTSDPNVVYNLTTTFHWKWIKACGNLVKRWRLFYLFIKFRCPRAAHKSKINQNYI